MSQPTPPPGFQMVEQGPTPPAGFVMDRRKPQENFYPQESSMGGNFLAGIGGGMHDLYTGAKQRLGIASQEDVDEKARLDRPLKSTGMGMAGNIAGKVATSLPAMFIPGANTPVGAAVIGGGLGALEPTETGESVGKNVALGAAGGAIGQIAGQALGRVLRPVEPQLSQVEKDLASAAVKRGIPLDAADLTGSKPLKTMRDVMAQMPLTADRQAAIQGTKQAAFNRAVGGTFGASEDALTPEVMQAARSRIGKQFTDLSARNNLVFDNAARTKLGEVVANAERYSTPDVQRVVQNLADDVFSRAQGSTLEGPTYRALDSEMGRLLRNTSNGDVRHYVGALRSALRESMDSSISAADKAAWQGARKQYANLMTVAPLAAKSETGDVSGKTLLAAALRGNKSAAFTGGGDLGELGRIGRAFVAEQTPNSGTPQRLFFQRLLENPVRSTISYGLGGASLPAQKLMNSKAGQAYLSHGLVPLGEQQRALVNALARSAGAAAPLGYSEQ